MKTKLEQVTYKKLVWCEMEGDLPGQQDYTE
jgi:hypothetical protein